MNGSGVYLYRAVRRFASRVAYTSDASDGLVLLVAGLAAVGVLVIALTLGLPA